MAWILRDAQNDKLDVFYKKLLRAKLYMGIKSPLWQEAYRDCKSDVDKGIVIPPSKACTATSSIDELGNDETLMKQYEEFKKSKKTMH